MPQTLPIVSPIKGVVRSIPREGQAPDTLWDAVNVLPYDRYGRKRLSQRGGLAKQFNTQLAASFVQGMIEAPNIIYPPHAWVVPQLPTYDFPVPFPLVTPGTYGPYTVPPQGSWSTSYTWEWTFTAVASLTVNWTDGVGAADGNLTAGGNVYVTIDVGASNGKKLFIELAYNGSLASENGFPLSQTLNVNVFYGADLSHLTTINSYQYTGTAPVLGATSCAMSQASQITITLAQIITPGGTFANPLTATQFPQVTFMQATAGQVSASANATLTASSLNVTD